MVQLSWQATLPTWDASPALSFTALTRTCLDRTSWVDHCRCWLNDADELMAEIAGSAAWVQRQRPMYDAMVTEPRLVTSWGMDELPESLEVLRSSLSEHYAVTFDSVHTNLYRSGSDSVAWHGDTVRKVLKDPLVAIVSLGEPRAFRLRPRGGGKATGSFALGGGGLLVMGGAIQHDYEHSVPKVAAAGPRMSVTFRHSA